MDSLASFAAHKKIPFYVFAESYGGKMTADFAEALQKAISAGTVTANFRGIGLGDSWISPVDYVYAWGPFVFATSLVNEAELARIQSSAKQTEKALDRGDYEKAFHLWATTEGVVEQVTDVVSFYNILRHHEDEVSSLERGRDLPSLLRRYHAQTLSQLMNGPIRKKLGIIPENVEWGLQAGEVFGNLELDFMKDVIGTVDRLLSMGVNAMDSWTSFAVHKVPLPG